MRKIRAIAANEQTDERTNERITRQDSTSYREVSPDSRDSDKNIIRMQRAFRCLAPRVQCHALHPRKTCRPSVRSWREFTGKRERKGEREREIEIEKERADRGEKEHRYRATGSGTTATIVFLRRRKIRTPWIVIPAASRRSSVAAFNRADRGTWPDDTLLLLRYGYCYYVRECDNEADEALPSVNDTERYEQIWMMISHDDGAFDQGRRNSPVGRGAHPRIDGLSALPANIFSAYAHSSDMYGYDKVAYRNRRVNCRCSWWIIGSIRLVNE